jgi:putative aminopeptidase FrvX
MRAESLEFLKEIVNTPSPSGQEQDAARVFRRYVKDFVQDLRTDVHGNTYAVLNPGAEFRVMLAGHIDEIGFIVHFIGDDGLLYFKGVGGHDSFVPIGQRVWVHGATRVPGVIGRKPIHLIDEEGDSERKAPKLHDLSCTTCGSTLVSLRRPKQRSSCHSVPPSRIKTNSKSWPTGEPLPEVLITRWGLLL